MGGAEVKTYPAVPYVIPADLAVDIDTPEDWDRAERMFKLLPTG
jgi:CMP-N-acetylneuraminic acid synthetase